MNSVRYFFGRALQLLGMATITLVVFQFFTTMGMETLLYWTILGIGEFYGGTLILGKSDS
ncbi:MAG: hypothetical protein G3M70_00320 [Candidatus Nitronauta litoralis]|uniref:Uncharacterized protein n=1 Tax=Candidatus Nitronauta litoralis TaxID=2705533 RepID=A0A7T0BT23_9BACT|nr:MAG: hypothetical protein G3M70_00320 [Candidatus Nitronauta litoralis]